MELRRKMEIGSRKRKSNDSQDSLAKRTRSAENEVEFSENCKAGKIRRILMRNFMCHDALEVRLNPYVNFIIGRNGSGKSAILTALTIGLGARATVTNRGASIKNFIKKGKSTATIEITLYNGGPMAYKPEVYGDSIVVCRTIGNNSSYKLRDSNGKEISKKRSELSNIIRALNIQIENPISILNQDISRTFLVASKPAEKYQLFMRATLLDVIGNNYKEAEANCKENYEKLGDYKKILSDKMREVEELQRDVKRAEDIDKFRGEADLIDNELLWAIATSEEKKLRKHETDFEQCEKNLKQLEGIESSVESRDVEMNNEIQKLTREIAEAERQVNDNTSTYNDLKQRCSAQRNAYSTKTRESRLAQVKAERSEENAAILRKEIQRLESGDNDESRGNAARKKQLNGFEQKLDEIEALLRTKQTHQMHLKTDELRLVKELEGAKIQMRGCENRLEKARRDLKSSRSHSSDALTVFGRNIPRLLRRIEEEHENGGFRQKPRGPLGAYIKMKDPSWSPAVEHFLGPSTISAFCVDNSHDAKTLNAIIREIYMNERKPQIVCSKFFEQVHDVSAHCVASPRYSSLLNAMEISDPVIANCLIDQREAECILLVPTSGEAAEIMSDAARVPSNCKRAFTKRGDTFFPDPQYRSYGGPRGLKARFLQVSITDVINALEEEIKTIATEKSALLQSYQTTNGKHKQTTDELKEINSHVSQLRAKQDRLKASIAELKDKIEETEATSVTVYRNELAELEKKLQQERQEETALNENANELKQSVESLETEIKKHREMRQNLDTRINPLKAKIEELENQRDELRSQSSQAAKRLVNARQSLQIATAELEKQRRCAEKSFDDARKRCVERIETEKSVTQLQRLSRESRSKIAEIEQQFGNIDEMRKELQSKLANCGNQGISVNELEESFKLQLRRMEERKRQYEEMMLRHGAKVKKSFATVLQLRKKKGTINIDHAQKTLELKVQPLNNDDDDDDESKSVNDTRSLSGGERSYSTVAFILALWESTGLPFYFLDEFDVFMDKVNRRAIMDILLDHTKTHPQCQFTFLTPLDTSNVPAVDTITIHQLQPPERENEAK